ncbi:hypothetical protein ACJIZ3_015950 [Penstemon smallii]|uniref:J domain-containing protein n=1 Tax=Penstemon smallii TaxID=265156 RepID=A0ABD3RNZ3_9LAMI
MTPSSSFQYGGTIGISPLSFSNAAANRSIFTRASKFKPLITSPNRVNRVSCCFDDEPLTASSAYDVLGVDVNCSAAQLKAAFRTKVKQYHPDVVTRGGGSDSDIMIRRVIQAYEILSNYSKSEIIERECLDPFDQPECEAIDLFVNEVLCVGKGCPYSCVNRAPHVFKFSSVTGTAHATLQDRWWGLGDFSYE